MDSTISQDGDGTFSRLVISAFQLHKIKGWLYLLPYHIGKPFPTVQQCKHDDLIEPDEYEILLR